MAMNIILNKESFYKGKVDGIEFVYDPDHVFRDTFQEKWEFSGKKKAIKKLGKPFLEWQEIAKKRIKKLIKSLDK